MIRLKNVISYLSTKGKQDTSMSNNTFRNAFRRTLNSPTLSHILRHSSNIFASDFNALRNKDPQDIQCALITCREYEREFWDPRWKRRLSALSASAAEFKHDSQSFVTKKDSRKDVVTKEDSSRLVVPSANSLIPLAHSEKIHSEISRRFYFRRSGESFGIFVLDLWDQVWSEDGKQHEHASLLSKKQWTCLSNALNQSDWMHTIVLVSTSPIVFDSTDDTKLKQDLSSSSSSRT